MYAGRATAVATSAAAPAAADYGGTFTLAEVGADAAAKGDAAATEKKDPRPQLWRLSNLGAAVHSGASPAFTAITSPSAFAATASAQPAFLFVHGMNFQGSPDDAFNDLVAHWEEATGAFAPGGAGGCTDATCQAYILVRE